MKSVLVVGAGRFGYHVCKKLDELGHQVMVIDRSEDHIESVLPYVDSAQIGDATDEDFLRNLGADNFDLCIVAIGDDFQSSLETTFLLKDLGAPFVVSRATSSRHARFLSRNGADKVVYPEEQFANWTAITYSSERIFDYIDVGEDFAIYEVDAPKEWYGKTITDVNIRAAYGCNILALRVDGTLTTNFGPGYKFNAEDRMLVLGHNKDVYKCFGIK